MSSDARPPRPPPPTHGLLGRLRLDGDPLRGAPGALAAQWRGAAASRFPGDPAFHGHDGARTVPRYPEVQYRWVEGAPCLYAFGPAAERALTHPWLGGSLTLGGETRTVAEVSWRTVPLARSFSRRLVRYTLGAPWLPLNQENHARYRRLDDDARRAELDRILVGNLLTMSQAFGWYFGEAEVVYAAFEPREERSCAVKDVPHVGFTGGFVTNLALPDHLALGRAVSHGFGWFTRASPEEAAG
jgi:hypothetical protein